MTHATLPATDTIDAHRLRELMLDELRRAA